MCIRDSSGAALEAIGGATDDGRRLAVAIDLDPAFPRLRIRGQQAGLFGWKRPPLAKVNLTRMIRAGKPALLAGVSCERTQCSWEPIEGGGIDIDLPRALRRIETQQQLATNRYGDQTSRSVSLAKVGGKP